MIVPNIRIETPRLILRPTLQEDLEGFAEFAADEQAMRFIGGTGPRAQAWRAMVSMAGSWALYGYAMFSVIEKSSGRWIGRLGPWKPEGWPGTEIGWGLLPAYWGKGYATEGAAATMDFAADRLGWTEIVHTIDPANTASVAVAKRLGSRLLRRATLPPPFAMEIDVWGQSAEQWRANRQGVVGSGAAA